ncbi:tether containing UBX domain for GLUT4 isoform X2 [Nomia melanderi]|uniref:tether containing UBX domain for GLUT4 isoform X2 n=1 Tax=Nomia melanderi TaxID=2448451 RepID=UPI0013042AB4|nr:tether containing UBX domain for GLUT4 isoform X2 [Nomia melanderi]
MAANKSVTVLTPNARRQTVKITPNTTIFQVLEEACKKHGYNVDDYDIKYRNQVLDINTIFRFTVIPNHAQLEMVPCTKARSKSTVTVCIQLESGERVMNDFTPNMTLADVLLQMCPNEELDKTVLTYMHREVYGTTALKSTTLSLLGLTHGKAMLRLMHRNSEETNSTTCTTSSKSSNTNEKTGTSEKTTEEESKKLQDCSEETETKESNKSKICTTEENEPVPSTSTTYPNDNNTDITESCTQDEMEDTNQIEFLGERNALVFNHAMVQALSRDEFPDSFYDLTVDDAKVLLRDAKRRREELEEAPLLTTVQREANHEQQTSTKLDKYYQSIIRIQFPDQFVLQGLFESFETVQTIKNFIADYLSDPNSDFTIFTAPPKHILDPDKRLIDEDLVPSAIIYYSGSSNLKPEIKEKLIDPKEIEIQVNKVRMSMVNPRSPRIKKNTTSINADSKSNCNANTDTSLSENKTKAPKWFNPSLK